MGDDGDWGATFAGTSMDTYEGALLANDSFDVAVCQQGLRHPRRDHRRIRRRRPPHPHARCVAVGAKVQALDPEGMSTLRRTVENATASLIDSGAISGMMTSHTATGTA